MAMLYINNIDGKLREEFKKAVFLRGKTMKAVITEFMQSYIEETKKLEEEKNKE